MSKRLVPASVRALLACSALACLPIFNDATIEAYRQRQAEVSAASMAILARADAEQREPTDAEQREVKALSDEFDAKAALIENRETALIQAASLNAPRERQAAAEPTDGDVAAAARPANSATARPPAQTAARVVTARGNGGFTNMGEFAHVVRMASQRGGGELDARLRNAAVSTYGNEGTGADGGFAVPPDFRSEIMSRVFGEDSLIARTDRMQTSSNSLTMPIDMTSPWGTTGVQAYWTAEGGTKTQSKPALQEVTVKLHTLATLVPVTEELLEDSSAMDSYLRKVVPAQIDFKVSDSIVWGDGAGKPLGLMNSPALVTVAAESAQTASTINVTNLAKMWGRLPAVNRRTAVWLMHPDVEAQLPLMSLANMPVYMPPGGVSGNAYGTLWGRPVIPHQTAKSIGTLGDIILTDLNSYLTVTKTGGGRDANGLRTDVSIHLWFDQDMVAYRFTMRVAGQPWWSSTLAQKNGSNVQSPFIALAAR